MSSHNRLIAFDRPLSGATIPGHSAAMYTDSDLAAARAAAYREGADSARGFGERQLVEFRDEVQTLQDGLFVGLGEIEGGMLGQLRTALPDLALDLARRLLAGFEPPPELLEKLCVEALEQLYPERDNLELTVSPRDAALLAKLTPGLESRYPNLRIRADAAFAPGDCQVRSRFGITDARQSAKIAAIQQELVGAA
jgi:flagellar assembly protein FliH